MSCCTGEAWARGHVLPLQTDDISPFAMGHIAPGASRLAAECSMFRAAAFPHVADATDFLLVSNRESLQQAANPLTHCGQSVALAPSISSSPCCMRPASHVQVRKPTGQMFLRELTGCLAVGQQEPQQRVPTPMRCRCAPPAAKPRP